MHLFIFKLAVVQLYGGSPLKTILERLSNTPQHLFKIPCTLHTNFQFTKKMKLEDIAKLHNRNNWVTFSKKMCQHAFI